VTAVKAFQLFLFYHRPAVLACKCGNVPSERSIMTKNIGMLLLAIYLILVGITTLFHVAIGAIVMGILALITGILILVGK
jgi:hypothetical protein